MLSPAMVTPGVALPEPLTSVMLVWPEGSTLPAKSDALAGFSPVPSTCQLTSTLLAEDRPCADSVKYAPGYWLAWYSRTVALVAAMVTCTSSFFSMPATSGSPMMASPADGWLSAMRKPSLGSQVSSPFVTTVTVFVASPAAKLTSPAGNMPPKSASSMLAPEAAGSRFHATEAVCDRSPVRTTWNVKARSSPSLPSNTWVVVISNCTAG